MIRIAGSQSTFEALVPNNFNWSRFTETHTCITSSRKLELPYKKEDIIESGKVVVNHLNLITIATLQEVSSSKFVIFENYQIYEYDSRTSKHKVPAIASNRVFSSNLQNKRIIWNFENSFNIFVLECMNAKIFPEFFNFSRIFLRNKIFQHIHFESENLSFSNFYLDFFSDEIFSGF